MTTIQAPVSGVPSAGAARAERKPGSLFYSVITTTNHKTVAYLYIITASIYFGFGGLLALLLRTELARPGLQILTPEQYNQTFTIHVTIMLLFFATPLFAGFVKAIMPL